MDAITRPSDDFDGDGYRCEYPENEVRCDVCGGATVPHVTVYSSCRRCTSCGELVHVTRPRPPITIREASGDRNDVALNELTKMQYELSEERIHELGG